MTKLRKRLKDIEAKLLGFDVRPMDGDRNPRYYIDDNQWKRIKEFRSQDGKTITIVDTEEETKQDNKFWAWNNGKFMNIEQMCEHYNLPFKDVHSYKIVSHTGEPYYNILFKENVVESKEIDFNGIAEKYASQIHLPVHPKLESNTFDRLVITDVHIGMTPNKEGNAMYDNKWDKREISRCASKIAINTINRKQSDILVIEQLGDLVDGFNGFTTRGGHQLPQNMSNLEQFDVAVGFLTTIIDCLIPHYSEIQLHNVCNDNHAGDFGAMVCKMVKSIAEMKWERVKVFNHYSFISHYVINNSVSLISHGKDKVHNKFGFKPILDTKQIEKIDQYIKYHNLYKYPYIRFSKGDSHQAIFDDTTSNDFSYNNYPALSPPSEWVQTNFKNSKRGFSFESESFESGVVTRTMIYL